MTPDAPLPVVEGFTWSSMPTELALLLADGPRYCAARLTALESTGWLVWLDFDSRGPSSMLVRSELADAITETVDWATTFRDQLLARQHSGAPRRMDPMPVPRRGKRAPRR